MSSSSSPFCRFQSVDGPFQVPCAFKSVVCNSLELDRSVAEETFDGIGGLEEVGIIVVEAEGRGNPTVSESSFRNSHAGAPLEIVEFGNTCGTERALTSLDAFQCR